MSLGLSLCGGLGRIGATLKLDHKLCGYLGFARAGGIEGVVELEVAARKPVSVLSLSKRAITAGQSACLNRFP